MPIRRFVVPVTVDASGDATVYSPKMSGKLVSVTYAKTNFANGVDFTITAEATGETIWTETNVDAGITKYPRGATHSTAGVAALYVAAGTSVNDMVGLAADRIKIVVAAGGVSTTGTFHFVIDG